MQEYAIAQSKWSADWEDIVTMPTVKLVDSRLLGQTIPCDAIFLVTVFKDCQSKKFAVAGSSSIKR